MKFSDYLTQKYLEWQTAEGKRKTIDEFAYYLGVSQATTSAWMNGTRNPNKDNAVGLSKVLGMEIYDVLGIPRPDPDLIFIQTNWGQLDEKSRSHLRKMTEKFKQGNSLNEQNKEKHKPKPAHNS